MTYTQLNNKREDKMTVLFNELQVFFAFNNEQFKEGAKSETKITDFGGGGYVPTKNYKKLTKALNELTEWHNNEIKKLDSNDVIHYELGNYECYYTGDISGAMDVLKSYGYTVEQVREVYNNNYADQEF